MRLYAFSAEILLFLLPLLFFALFYLYPLFGIVGYANSKGGGLLNALATIGRTPYYRQIITFTIGQATLSTLLTLLIAFPSAYLFAHFRFWGKRAWQTLSTLPFVLPTIVVAIAFRSLWPARQSLTLILLAHLFYNFSIASRLISTGWQNVDTALEQSAQTLGANRWQRGWWITRPILQSSVIAAASLIFVFTFTSFGVILILGGFRYATLEVEIYRQAIELFNLPMAATLSLIQIGATFLLLLLQRTAGDPLGGGLGKEVGVRPIRTIGEKLLLWGNLLLIGGMIGAPLIALIARSLQTAQGWSLHYYQLLTINSRNSLFFAPPLTAMTNSLKVALLTTFFALILGLIAIEQLHRPKTGWLNALFFLPLATSAVTLGFGFILMLNRPPLSLRQSPLLIPCAHTLVALPFVIRTLLPTRQQINPGLLDAARLLGADGWRRWWHIIWPLLRRATLAAAIFAFTISMGEFGASSFVARPQAPTLPVAIFRLLGQAGQENYGQALAMSVLLLLLCSLAFLLMERLK